MIPAIPTTAAAGTTSPCASPLTKPVASPIRPSASILNPNSFGSVGVAAPMAFFPFAGWKNSFFGDLHAHGKDAVMFYTEQKVLMTRWF